MEAVLGIDVGTSIRPASSPRGASCSRRKIDAGPPVDDSAYAAVTDGLKRILDAHDATPEDVIACGLDIPGPVADDGTVGFLPNIKLDPEGLVGAISSVFPRAQIAFVNDANAAALGEMWAGVAHGTSSYVLIALGTGVGSRRRGQQAPGSGRLWRQAERSAASRSTPTRPDLRLRPQGCQQQYASAKASSRLYLAECEALAASRPSRSSTPPTPSRSSARLPPATTAPSWPSTRCASIWPRPWPRSPASSTPPCTSSAAA